MKGPNVRLWGTEMAVHHIEMQEVGPPPSVRLAISCPRQAKSAESNEGGHPGGYLQRDEATSSSRSPLRMRWPAEGFWERTRLGGTRSVRSYTTGARTKPASLMICRAWNSGAPREVGHAQQLGEAAGSATTSWTSAPLYRSVPGAGF